MKLGVLFSGGKDSMHAISLAKKEGHEISCLISIISKNKESYMFHTPSIDNVDKQAKVMNIPIIKVSTEGKKEDELRDLESAIRIAIKSYGIQGIVSGAIESVYQASRIQNITNQLNIECFNPLWQKDPFKYLEELMIEKYEIIITGVFAYPMDKSYLGKKIDKKFINKIKELNEKYQIHPTGEGGEYESLVLNSPIFSKRLKVVSYQDFGEKNSWRREAVLG